MTMSASNVPYPIADDTVRMFTANLFEYATRYLVVGAMRRIRSHLDAGGVVSKEWGVNRVEVLAIPGERFQFVLEKRTLFGEEGHSKRVDTLAERLEQLRYPVVFSDNKQIRLWIPFPESRGAGQIPCVLHLCSNADNWGYLVAKHTGPQEFWTRMQKPDLNLIPKGFVFHEHALSKSGTGVVTESEMAFFDAIETPYLYPHERAFWGAIEEK